MPRRLLKLTWLEIKIFVREPMGVIGTVGIPVAVFLIASRLAGPRSRGRRFRRAVAGSAVLPVLASILMALSAISSLVTIISIYREGGILKRLRATPLSPTVILSAHVLVKLLFTVLTLVIMVLARPPVLPSGRAGAAVLVRRGAHVHDVGDPVDRVPHRQHRSDGSLCPAACGGDPVPDDRRLGTVLSRECLPQWMRLLATVLPLGYAVSLLDGIWRGEGWAAHLGDVAALTLFFVVFTAISSRLFRWE